MRLSLTFLGPIQVALDGRAVMFGSHKIQALLVYLAVEDYRPHARENMAGLLWPGYPSRAALNSLRSALASLRGSIADRAADPPFLIIARDTVHFNPQADFFLDVALLAEGANRSLEQDETLVTVYRGEFLEGFSLPDSAPFEQWLLARRERYRRVASEALVRLASYHETSGSLDRAISYSYRMLELEAWDETAHRRLMRLLALSDRRSQALAQYERCRNVLLRELGVGPSHETVELYERIRDDSFKSAGS